MVSRPAAGARGTNVQLLGWDKSRRTVSFTQSFDDQTQRGRQRFISQGAGHHHAVAGPGRSGCGAAIRQMALPGSSALTPTGTSQPIYSSIVLTSVMKDRCLGRAGDQDSGQWQVQLDRYDGTLADGGVSVAVPRFRQQGVRGLREPDQLTDDIKSGGKLVIES